MQSNEVGGSRYMEKGALEKVLKSLDKDKFTVNVLVTDRHRQIGSVRYTHTLNTTLMFGM